MLAVGPGPRAAVRGHGMKVSRGAFGALGGVVITAGGWLGYQLFLHYGRLLVRLEEMERRGGHPSLPPVAGLPLGTVVHDFELAGHDGGHVTLSQWRGRAVLLVFVDVRCGFSRELVRDIDALPSHPDGVVPQVLILTAEDSEDTRRLLEERPPRWPVLLQEASEVALLYRVDGTPMAYLVDEEGLTASLLVAGKQAVLELAEAAFAAAGATAAPRGVDPPGHQRPARRDGLPVGAQAPSFRLPLLAGGEVALEDHRGQRVLLVFSDPTCRPCVTLAPELERVHRQVPGLHVLMVSRGDRALNQAMAAGHRLTFPVALQRHWEISRDYAMVATPIAYLLDENGVVIADVAVGARAILALVPS